MLMQFFKVFLLAALCPLASVARGSYRFRGFDGYPFMFKGRPGRVYNLITCETLQLNALFVKSPKAPKSPKPPKPPKSPADEKMHIKAIGIIAGPNTIVAATPDFVVVNDRKIVGRQTLHLHDEGGIDDKALLLLTKGRIELDSVTFKLIIDVLQGDGFMFLDIDSSVDSKHLVNPHGVLGQTAQFLVDDSEPQSLGPGHENLHGDAKKAQKFLDGSPNDYFVVDGLLGTNFTFNRFVFDPARRTPSSPRNVQFRRYGYGRSLPQE